MGGTQHSHNARGRPAEGPWTMRQPEEGKDSGINLKAGLASDLEGQEREAALTSKSPQQAREVGCLEGWHPTRKQ